MEIRFNIDDDFMRGLQAKTKEKGTDVARSALSLFSWAVDEVSRGRVILSSDEEGNQLKRLAMPALDRAKASNGNGHQP